MEVLRCHKLTVIKCYESGAKKELARFKVKLIRCNNVGYYKYLNFTKTETARILDI